MIKHPYNTKSEPVVNAVQWLGCHQHLVMHRRPDPNFAHQELYHLLTSCSCLQCIGMYCTQYYIIIAVHPPALSCGIEDDMFNICDTTDSLPQNNPSV